MRYIRNMTKQPEPLIVLDDVRRLVGKWSVDCGARMAKWRTERGFDRATLAALVGTSEATIHRIESGKLHPRDHLKLGIASALLVEVGEIWTYPSRKDVHAAAAA